MANDNQEVLKDYFINCGLGIILPVGPTTPEKAIEEAKEKRKTNPAVTLWEKTKDQGVQQVNFN